MHEIRRVHEMFRRAHDTIYHMFTSIGPCIVDNTSFLSPSLEPTVDYAWVPTMWALLNFKK